MECSHCGRQVEPTTHRRNGNPPYQVGYYRLLTGTVRQRIIKSAKDEAETFVFYSLQEPTWIITCPECLKNPEIADRLDFMFRGLPEDAQESSE